MIKLFKIATVFAIAAFASSAHAAFPDDLEGVVFVEGASMERIRDFAVTSDLEVSVTAEPQNVFGRIIFLNYDKRFDWPGDSNGVNGNVWGFIERDGVWYAGTWEYMGYGRNDRSESSFVGPKHLRFAPLQNFRPRNGEVYGFMVTPVVRNGTTPSVRERTDIDFWRWGEGPVEASELFGTGGGDDTTTKILPSMNLLLNEEAAVDPTGG